MADQAKHSPLPWSVLEQDLAGDGKAILDALGRRVAYTSAFRNRGGKILDNPIEAEEAVANAALIVRAVNALHAPEGGQ
jgi:hypothetical protein